MARASRYEDVKRDLLVAISGAEVAHAKAPTVRDMASAHGVSVSTMHSYLTRLREEGLIEWRQGRHRTTRITPAGSQQLSASAV